MAPEITIGIDLASGDRDTALCGIDWSSSPARLMEPPSWNLSDEVILGMVARDGVIKIAIDAPLGWPLSFAESVREYTDSGRWPELSPDELRFRATEHVIRQAGANPISSVTDKLGWTTIRCARLLSRLSSRLGFMIERAGQGLVVEAYPAAALRAWGLTSESGVSYKSAKNQEQSAQERRRMLGEIQLRLLGVLYLDEADVEACAANDHVFDALICALVARCCVAGSVEPIPEGMRWLASREGWICVPLADSLGKGMAS